MQSVEALMEKVRQQGGKVTAQRLLIWHALAADRTHSTAEELYSRLKPAAPTLSMTTLYHVLNELVEWGEVRRFDTGDGHLHYDSNTQSHAELICMRCHSVMDAPADAPGSAVPVEVPRVLAGYQIVTRSEQYYGFCPACQQAMASAPTV